jgi:hypothetical protein
MIFEPSPTWKFWIKFTKKCNIHTKPLQQGDPKSIENSQSYVKKSDFDPPSWIDTPFLDNMT